MLYIIHSSEAGISYLVSIDYVVISQKGFRNLWSFPNVPQYDWTTPLAPQNPSVSELCLGKCQEQLKLICLNFSQQTVPFTTIKESFASSQNTRVAREGSAPVSGKVISWDSYQTVHLYVYEPFCRDSGTPEGRKGAGRGGRRNL